MSTWKNEWEKDLTSIWKMGKAKSLLKEKATYFQTSIVKLTYLIDVTQFQNMAFRITLNIFMSLTSNSFSILLSKQSKIINFWFMEKCRENSKRIKTKF